MGAGPIKYIPPGTKFGRLTVLGFHGVRNGRAVFSCKCSCGRPGELLKVGVYLRQGTNSCGCIQKENTRRTGRANLTHGMIHSPEYKSWAGMRARCYCPSNKDYANWGGRGIVICAEWRTSFPNFYRDVGKRPDGLPLTESIRMVIIHAGNVKNVFKINGHLIVDGPISLLSV